MEHKEFQQICNFLKCGAYNSEFQASSAPAHQQLNFIRKLLQVYIGYDAKLYKKAKVDGKEVRLQVMLSSELSDLLQKFHDDFGHPGIKTTFKAIHKRYYCSGIYKDVAY